MAIISVAYARIAFRLWGSKPPGAAVDERDHNILVNKKKVSISFSYSIYYTIGSSLFLGFIETSCFSSFILIPFCCCWMTWDTFLTTSFHPNKIRKLTFWKDFGLKRIYIYIFGLSIHSFIQYIIVRKLFGKQNPSQIIHLCSTLDVHAYTIVFRNVCTT